MTISAANIVHSGVPSRTALRVAILRAAHQLLDDPIVFDDPVALPILGKELSRSVQQDLFQFNDPMQRGLRAACVLRSRVAEGALGQAVESGVLQYVVLGAGLDTFAYRNPYRERGLRVFEVDHPSTQTWKKKLLEEAGIATPPELTFAAVDFEKTTLQEGLIAAGFRMDQPACFSWLGVTHYLTEQAVYNTLQLVASLPTGTSISFDFRVLAELLHPVERVLTEFLAQYLASMGESWQSAFDPAALQTALCGMGFESATELTSTILNSRYFARRKDGLHAGGGFRMMQASR